MRTCYSQKLVDGAERGADATGKANPPDFQTMPKAYDYCFTPGGAQASNPDHVWLHTNQERAFKYIMFTRQGGGDFTKYGGLKFGDFSIDEQNKVIDAYYLAQKQARPRRVIDTSPSWSKAQPRYEAIRAFQVAQQGNRL